MSPDNLERQLGLKDLFVDPALILLGKNLKQITGYIGKVNINDEDFGVWKEPGPDDLRGPCPALNTLANHGYLPRDGRNVYVSDIIFAMDKYLGIGSDTGLLQFVGAGVRGVFKPLSSGIGLPSLRYLADDL